jgi:hypothetical protein
MECTGSGGTDASGTPTYTVTCTPDPVYVGVGFTPGNGSDGGKNGTEDPQEITIRAKRLPFPRLTLWTPAFSYSGGLGCNSPLPDGTTVGDKVRQLRSRENQANDIGNGLSGALTFFTGVNTGGLLDFKDTMSGPGFSGTYLAAAGNFAYGSAGADYFGNSFLGSQITYAGGFAYALSHGKANTVPPGTIFPQDASGAQNIGPGLKSGGCQ